MDYKPLGEAVSNFLFHGNPRTVHLNYYSKNTNHKLPFLTVVHGPELLFPHHIPTGKFPTGCKFHYFQQQYQDILCLQMYS